MVVYVACHVVCVSNMLSYIHIALSYYIGVTMLHHSVLFLIRKRFNSKSPKEGGVEFPVALFLSKYKLHIHYSQSYSCQVKGVDIFSRVRL